MDFRQAGWGGGDVVRCGFLLSNIFFFKRVRLTLLAVYPLCGCQECVAGVGGCFSLSGGEGEEWREIRRSGAQHKG